MDTDLHKEKKETGGKLSPYWAGRQKQEDRDGQIKLHIDTYRVVTVELLMGLLDMPPTLSSRRIVETRLARMVKLKYIRQIRDGYVTYYVTPLVIKKGNPQLEHKLMESYAWIALERAVPVEHRLFSDAIRKQGGQLIPDGACVIKRHGYFLEIDTSLDDLGTLADKAHKYDKHASHLKDTLPDWMSRVDSERVLFITRRAGRVHHIIEKLKGIGSGEMFLVTCQDNFNPFDGSILTPVWRSPRDTSLHTLLED